MELFGHRMVKNHLIGGWPKMDHLLGQRTDQLLEWTCPASTPESCTFEPILTKLKFARAYHIVLPVTEEFAKQFCS